MNETNTKDVLYDLQFKQKYHIMYFPLSWQGLLIAIFCWMLPLNMMEAGGVYLLIGFIVYRVFIVRKDFEFESIVVLKTAVDFIHWIKVNRKRK